MTILENEYCKIEIAIDDSYENDRDFNSKYDIVIKPIEYSKNHFYKAYAIQVSLKDRKYSVALIGDYNCQDENCGVLEDGTLTVLQGWTITQFDLIVAQVTRSVVINSMAPNFEIHRVNAGFLIYGETDITMLDDNLEMIWSFSGRDIFVSATGKKAFEIKDDRICLFDFEDRYYELDFYGNVLLCVD